MRKLPRFRPAVKIHDNVLPFAVLLLLLLLAASAARAEDLSKEEHEYLRRKGVVVFVSQTHYPPFEFRGEDGDHTGMCVELARWIATRFGFKTRFIDASFKQAQEAVLSGQADVITSLFFSKKRDEIFDFTHVMFKVPASIFVRADRPDIKDIKGLNGKTIAMQAGDYAQEFLESKNIRFKVAWTKTFAEATDLVIAGKADAIIGDEQIVLYHIYSNHLTDMIKKVGPPLYIGQNCMGLKQGQHLLQGILNKGIALARQTGTLQRINTTWLGTRFVANESFVVRYWNYLLAGAALLALFALLAWTWNIRLRTQVAKRTQALARTEETLKAILAKSPLGIGLVKNRKLDWHNRAMREMLGYGPGELKGLKPDVLYADSDELGRADELIRSTLRNGRDAQMETRWVRADGAVIDCMVRFAILERNGKGATIIAIAEDITERKRLERQLRESQKMESLGTLSGGIAHEFNNILAVIMGYAELSLPHTANQPALRSKLGMIIDAGQKARDMVSQILTFSRQVATDFKVIDIDAEVGRAVDLLRQTLPRMIKVELELGQGTKLIDGNSNQIQQILLNLASNARDAMPEGGTLTLKTSMVELDDEFCRVRPGLQPGPHVLLQVMDTGLGMPQQTLEHVFDPFFTTKEVGKGTGLGLSTVHGLVKLHGGHIFCVSSPGEGSVFQVYLPSQPGAQKADAPETPLDDLASPAAMPGGHERILLVDDEPQLRTLGESLLRPLGYEVLTAKDGEEAIELFRRNKGSIDLVILDLGMPGMGGREALKRLLVIDPSAKVIITSGYSDDAQVRASHDQGAKAFVAKPFQIADLLATIRAVLDQA